MLAGIFEEHGGAAGGALKRGVLVENHAQRKGFEERAEAAFVSKTFEKGRLFEFWQNFWRNAAAQKNPAGGEDFQGHVATLGSEQSHEEVEGFFAQRRFSFERGFGNHRGRIFVFQLLSERGGLGFAAGIAQEFVNIEKSGAGNNTLPTDMAKLRAQIFQKLVLEIRLRSETGVTSFARQWPILTAVPIEHGLAQTCARRNDDSVTFRVRRARLQNGEIIRTESGDAVAVGFEIIDDDDLGDADARGEALDFDAPGKICGADDAFVDGPGDANSCGFGFGLLRGEEFADDVFESGVIAAGISFFSEALE